MRKSLSLSAALGAIALAATLQLAPAPASAGSYDPMVYRAQQALDAKGFDIGTPDGVMGPRTRAAIEAYQRASGMPATGAVSQNLVSQLEGGAASSASAGASSSSSWPSASAQQPAQDRWSDNGQRRGRMSQSDLIKQTQHELSRLGYDLNAQTGELNGETSDAIRNYQQRHGLDVTGMPSRRLLTQMRNDDTRLGANEPWRSNAQSQNDSQGNACTNLLHQVLPGTSNYNGPIPGC
jgi:peptidoglycan hydrolase-like protein with peptidoglycan-binding domain